MSQIRELTGGRRLSHDIVSEKGFYTRSVGDKCQIFSDFLGSGPLPLVGAAGSGASVFVNQDTSSAGSPTLTHLGTDDLSSDPTAPYTPGAYRMKFSNTDEAQKLTLYNGDQENIPGGKRIIFEARCRITGTFTADDRVCIGLASGRSATLDSIARNIWFRIEGANTNILVESDDSVTDIDDVDTGKDFVSGQYHTFKIDVSDIRDIKFFVDGDRCATPHAATNNKMTAAQIVTTTLQPFIEIQKDGGTVEHSIDVDYISVLWDRTPGVD